VRHASFGWELGYDLYHLGAILAFGIVMWRLAIWRTHLRLVD
jgi:hypothetical protein